MLLGCRSLSTWVRRLVACMGSCLGCCGCAKPAPIIAVDEPSKGLRIQGRSVRKANLSEDFWSTSVHKIENSAVQSQRSISSMSPALQSSDQHGDGSSSNPNEFVNQGLMQWNQTRQQWLGNKKFNFRPEKPREPKLSLCYMHIFIQSMCITPLPPPMKQRLNATYESLLGSNKSFSQPIPLAEMVDLLVDVWEQEGLYS
ncbi:uncharacterized protein LOC100839071 isoform X1 [Brachypodium distachyon]|uniref:uncharacterized protein LOC100839071 isoform X1 n=1 Tax=Brachypodium distachyon TaxID=15368 RepID=UPI0001C75E23|nr:uncharacterized protein LOC100839071 isoform X1 [Brachypodium distachyon]|eukprot:XP_024316048.1 uncharacterized protein LOC100839071 isoform X1 [Brachypodium distachyon]